MEISLVSRTCLREYQCSCPSLRLYFAFSMFPTLFLCCKHISVIRYALSKKVRQKIFKGRSFIVDHLNKWPLMQNLLGVQPLIKLLACDAGLVSTQNQVEEVRKTTGSDNMDFVIREESYSNTCSCLRPGTYCLLT